MQFIPPRLSKDKHNRYSVVFYVQGKRYRVSNGKKFGVHLHPNKEPLRCAWPSKEKKASMAPNAKGRKRERFMVSEGFGEPV